MLEILEELNNLLSGVFQKKLLKKDLFYFEGSNEMDVFKTLMFLKKDKNALNKLMLEASISIDELSYKYDKQDVKKCLEEKLLVRGTNLSSKMIFIGTNGLYEYYRQKNYNLNNIFIAFDSNRFLTNTKLNLKPQEKIWCIFLLVFGANNQENFFDTEAISNEELNKYLNFFKLIENKLIDLNINLGSKINWEKKSQKSFRSFIRTIVDLSKTQIYNSIGKYKYYLDLSNIKNAEYLLDLILDNYNGVDRLHANQLLLQALNDISFNAIYELGIISNGLDKRIIRSLKSN